jgi:aspartate/methionine/tyrosine aminotransferase
MRNRLRSTSFKDVWMAAASSQLVPAIVTCALSATAPGTPSAIFAATWHERRGIACDAANVVVTPGAKPVLFFAMLALLEPGDEVLIPSPAFPTYGSVASFVGARVVPVPLDAARGFDLDLAALRQRITARSRMLILNSPHNPTGAVLPRATLEGVAALAREHDLVVVSDEIYAGMVYDGESPSIATLPGMAERTVVVDGFSKTYAMTGWRLGYGIFPDWLAPQIAKLQINATSCTATFTQRAGVEALNGPQDGAHAMKAEFRRRRDVIVKGLNQIPGVSCLTPQGAFYVFPNITKIGKTSQELADLLLNEAGVATLPGTAFGPAGQGYLRFSYANSIENIQLALEKVGEVMGAIRA